MTLLFCAAILCQTEEEKQAAELLTKAEAAISTAKTLHYKATLRGLEDGVETHAVNVEAWLKGGKAKFKFSGKIEGANVSKTTTDESAAAPDYAAAARAVLLRAGTFFPILVIDDGDDLREVFTITDVKSAADEKVGDRVAKVLTFNLKTLNKPKACSVTLWIDKETLAPLRRTTKDPKGREQTEEFTSWVLNETLGDDVFKK